MCVCLCVVNENQMIRRFLYPDYVVKLDKILIDKSEKYISIIEYL